MGCILQLTAVEAVDHFCKLNPVEGQKPKWRLSVGSSTVADGDGAMILEAVL